jgi:ankyrin repeat protein
MVASEVASEKPPKTPNSIHTMIKLGDIEMVKNLINTGTDIEACDANGYTPLIVASMNNLPIIVQLLIDAGAKLDAEDKNNVTAINHAAYNGYTNVVELLIRSGANIHTPSIHGHTPLLNAVRNDQPDTARLLIKAGADVNIRSNQGVASLHIVAHNGSTEIVDILIGAGADINALNKYGDTPLIHAAMNNHTEIVSLLINAGADINAKSNNGVTAMSTALHQGHTQIVNLLKDAKIAPPNTCDLEALWNTAIHDIPTFAKAAKGHIVSNYAKMAAINYYKYLMANDDVLHGFEYVWMNPWMIAQDTKFREEILKIIATNKEKFTRHSSRFRNVVDRIKAFALAC